MLFKCERPLILRQQVSHLKLEEFTNIFQHEDFKTQSRQGLPYNVLISWLQSYDGESVELK